MQALGAAALLCLCGTFFAAQVDYFRRHTPGISPQRYWVPQLEQIWIPGLAAAGCLGVLAGVVAWRHRRRRGDGGP